MAKGTSVARFCAWWVALILAAAGADPGEELRTVADAVDQVGFDAICFGHVSGWPHTVMPSDLDEDGSRTFRKPVPWGEKPEGLRFFREGDPIWWLSGHLRQLKVLSHKDSWALWNGETGRLVMHGAEREHGLFAKMWGGLGQVRCIVTELALIKVPCRELEFVPWTEEEIEKRGGEVLTTVATTSRSGWKGKTSVGVTGGSVSLETESCYGNDYEVLDVRLVLSVPVPHAEGLRTLELKTALVVFAGHWVYVEVGGADGGEETYLVGVKVEPRFIDGTPAWQWRESEDPSVKESLPGSRVEPPSVDVQDDGSVLSVWQVPSTFLGDLVQGEPVGDDDPFALQKNNELAADRWVLVQTVPTGKSPGFPDASLVYDLATLMREHGIGIPEGRWTHFNPKTRTLIASLDAANTEILKTMMEPGMDGRRNFKMIQSTVSLIEWDGELAPGRIPAGARRLARVGLAAFPGQKVTVRHGVGDEQLERGVSLDLEPNIGATDRVIDLRVDLELAGARAAELSTALTMTDGEPVVLPLGQEDGRKFGVVVTGRVIDGTGLAAKRGE